MTRTLLKINELKRVYLSCNNSEKDRIVIDAINSIKALTSIPEALPEANPETQSEVQNE